MTVIVFGLQAMLGQFPDAPQKLRRSAAADMMPKYAVEKTTFLEQYL